ncbi:heavy metal-associated isoprenylated plant protein 28 [Solanum stenotomum]|uniref:heavy metal-associated isoprenylated plant protein 28 n=1 Tax=Solanum stenotomum TaxID=172797 RepID=UPI0020D04B32|nr:heavy metal-associated isoprenylated plant protein 28 [Solanum stenotomum]
MANMQIVPAGRNVNVEPQYVEMMVPLYSYGCERKINNALSHIKGIYSVNVDFEQQKVTVWGICNKYDVLARVRSKRKAARFWNTEDNNVVNMEEYSERDSSATCRYRIRPPLALIRARSLSWKLALKKAFTRSYSF